MTPDHVLFQMRFYAPPDQIDQVEYAVSIGGKIMTFFEKYYNIKYPLPKSGKSTRHRVPISFFREFHFLTQEAQARFLSQHIR